MIRPGLIGLLLVAVLLAVGILWWTDPSGRALEQVQAGFRQEEAERGPANAVQKSELLVAEPTSERTQIATRPQPEAAPPGEPVSRVTGVIVGDRDVFPSADRSGITVYCWPGWAGLAPAKVSSLRQLKRLQTTTTDAQGRFAFDLFIDDAHWVYAVGDSASSNPAGMRIGTKPGVQLTMEMRRLIGLSYRLEDPLDPRPIDAVRRMKVDLLNVPKAQVFDADTFPWSFFPRVRGICNSGEETRHGTLVAWLPPSAAPPFTARIHAEVPGFLPVDALFPAMPFPTEGELPLKAIPMDANTSFGEVAIEAQGIPEGVAFPFSAPLTWRLVEEETGQQIPIELRSPLDLPARRIRVPVGSYRLDGYEHSNVRLPLTEDTLIEVQSGKSTRVTADLSTLNFWVFQRDPSLDDLRYLTPPLIRVQNHQEPGFSDWDEPSQLVVIYPHEESTHIVISGDVFLEGPQGPRTEGRVTYYTAGTDDD